MAINQSRISRIGTPENLPNGSTYDVLLISVSEGYPVGEVKFKFEDTPRKITGIQKVAQIFLKILLTQKGSDLLSPTFGTQFSEIAIGANRTSEDDMFMSDIMTAVKDAESQTKAVTASLSGDLDSQLDKISIENIYIDRESLNMRVSMTTRAGETASVAIPFPELSLKLANA